MSQQVTTVTFFRHKGIRQKLWAFRMVGVAREELSQVKGLQFFRTMGSGKGLGFSPLPDWSVYCLLQVWDDHRHAMDFFTQGKLIEDYRNHSQEVITIFMHNIQAHGLWSGLEPFQQHAGPDSTIPYRAFITRATIRFRRLINFWSFVPTTLPPLERAGGLLFTKGIGELPIKQMATFSIWDSLDSMKGFAYQSAAHQKAIALTRKLGWYSEELFARFQPYGTLGKWQGKELLPGLELSEAVN